MFQDSTLDNHPESKRQKKQQANKYENGVEFKRGITPAGGNKRNSAGQEDRRAVQQVFAERKFSGSGAEPARFANIRVTLSSAIQTVSHCWARLPCNLTLMLCRANKPVKSHPSLSKPNLLDTARG